MAVKQFDTVKAVFSWLLYEKPDKSFYIGQFIEHDTNRTFAVLGPELPMKKSVLVDLYGEWTTDARTGKKQFRLEYYEIARQDTREGVVSYLQSLKCGVGKVKANKVYDRFGDKTWDILKTDPWRLREVPSIGASLTEKVITAIKNSSGLKDVVMTFTRANAKISPTQASKFVAAHSDPLEALKRNPYCACQIDGITFEKADAVADLLGFPPDHPERVKAFIYKAMSDAAMRGHVCLPVQELISIMVNKLGCTEQQCRDALNAAWQEEIIKTTNKMVYTAKSYEEEERIANEALRLLSGRVPVIKAIDPLIDDYESRNFKLADSQREAVKNVFISPLSIITGGPGTGKTTVIKAILDVFSEVYGTDAEPILLAPTGRAARRMSDATGYPARTIHSAVGYRGEDQAADLTEPLEGNLIIIDECSMMDQFIASVLLTKCESGSRVVLVGDPDQLPSVGAGNVLLDMIASQVIPTTKLSVIFRQAGENPIVYNAHAINQGRNDLRFERTFRQDICKDYAGVFEHAVNFYCRCVSHYGMDNVILLNPQRNNTDVSVDRFNKVLQERLNPHVEGKKEFHQGRNTFRIGDKVMQLKNTEVAKNGDVGYIRDIRTHANEDDPDSVVYEVDIEFSGDGVIHRYNSDAMRSVDLAYCSTVHKSQGEEYETVIMVVSKAHPSMLRRNLVYTGITRSRKNVCLISEAARPDAPSALDIAISNATCDTRYTNLIPRLRTKYAKLTSN